MTWECDVHADVEMNPSYVTSLQRLVEHAAAAESNAPVGDWSLTIRLTDDAIIETYHSEYFGEPTPTDVISFPSGDDLTAATGYLGDVIISVETAAAQAVTEGHSTEREVAFLALHGLLHLCGYTDRDESDRAMMLEKQEKLLLRNEHLLEYLP